MELPDYFDRCQASARWLADEALDTLPTGRKVSSEALKRASRLALEVQVASAEHLRDCDRCRHLFEIAYEETALSDNLVLNFSERLSGTRRKARV